MPWHRWKKRANQAEDRRTEMVLNRLESVADRMERFSTILERRLEQELEGSAGHDRTPGTD